MPPEGYYERQRAREKMLLAEYLETFWPHLVVEKPTAEIIDFQKYKATKEQ